MSHKNYPNQTVITLLLAAALAANTAVAADDLAARHHANIDNTNDSIVPAGISVAVSDVDMRMRLAVKPDAEQCVAENCLQNQAFDARVQQLGAQLSTAAYAQFPTLKNACRALCLAWPIKKMLAVPRMRAAKCCCFAACKHLS